VQLKNIKRAFSVVVGILFLLPIFTFADVVYSQPDASSVVGSGAINGFSAVKFGGATPSFDAPNGLTSIEMYGAASSIGATISLQVTCRTVNGSNWGISFCGDEWASGTTITIATGTVPGISPDYFQLHIATSVPFRSQASNNPNVKYYYYFTANVSSGNAMFYGTSTPNLCVIGCGSGIDFYGNPYFVFNTEEDSCTENCFSNILFLPGIEASRLYRPSVIIGAGEKELWLPGVTTMRCNL
jgi:hypothetical protein